MHYQKIALAAGALALASTVSTAARDWNTEAREPFHYSFSSVKMLDVDNVNGTIQVTGDGGNTIRIEGERVTHARDQRAIDDAKRDVKLDVNERDGIAQLYVNGPDRGNGHSSDYHGFHSHDWHDDYEVEYNFEIRVPRGTELRLQTVNGEVKTDQTSGRFAIHGINGPVTMKAMAGSGNVNVVNGQVDVTFRESPNGACEFRSVNGAIETTFPPNLAADIHVTTLNGTAYTDFDATALANGATTQKSNGRFVYKPDRLSRLRIGSGGPELRFQTVNGDIRIKKGR